MAKGQVVRMNAFSSLAEDMDAAVKGFINYCRAKNLSENTIIYYSYRLEAFKEYVEKNAPGGAPKNVTPTMIREFVADQSRKHSASTANHAIIALKAFFNYLVRDGFLETSPASSAERLRRKRTIIDTFSIAQIEAILKTCNKDFPGVRDRAILMLLFDCGLRASELCGLKTSDVSWVDHTLLVLGKGDKERLVPFGHAARQALGKCQAL